MMLLSDRSPAPAAAPHVLRLCTPKRRDLLAAGPMAVGPVAAAPGRRAVAPAGATGRGAAARAGVGGQPADDPGVLVRLARLAD
ncbi:hypothetical protein GCM10010124_38430 [Pilimelia terevasa]|uniref:Uncharacterized protein n=1 Tax=Pilimelia terevasa TaxID=53372 RepID=A0A8J3FJQ1_9ACTN|nr:hypothetical protein [Pilimelia terevasa]GGK41924.1 hypothetical protein GCM10010124_38430 [Pilimelia terevasa]